MFFFSCSLVKIIKFLIVIIYINTKQTCNINTFEMLYKVLNTHVAYKQAQMKQYCKALISYTFQNWIRKRISAPVHIWNNIVKYKYKSNNKICRIANRRRWSRATTTTTIRESTRTWWASPASTCSSYSKPPCHFSGRARFVFKI